MQQTKTAPSKETVTLIEEHVRYLLGIMGFHKVKIQGAFTSASDQSEVNQFRISISAGDEGSVLIGSHGNHLFALQHIIRSMMRQHLPSPTRVIVDVNDYLVSRERSLAFTAEEAAKKAIETGLAVTLQPMGASERHTVHTSLASREGIKTESLGEEPNRRVVIRPASTSI